MARKAKIDKKLKGATDKKLAEPTVIQATGKRKRAIAQIRYFPQGEGKILINERDLSNYFPYFEYQKIVRTPLEKTKSKGDILVKVAGGGIKSQAEAIRLGIARALNKFNKDFRSTLKKAGYLSRDARKKERKKPGLKRARRAPQWSKR